MLITSNGPTYPDRRRFDPLLDLDGLWTPALAERYLPIPGVPPARYECVDGRLVMTPRADPAQKFAAFQAARGISEAINGIGLHLLLRANIEISAQKWLEPDFVVLSQPPGDRMWTPPDEVLLAGDCLPSSPRRHDRVDRLALYAEAKIPYSLRIELDGGRSRLSAIDLYELAGGRYRITTSACGSHKFEAERPFPFSLDPAGLLDD